MCNKLCVNLSREQDPTGMSSVRSRARGKINSRLNQASTEIKQLFRNIPATTKREKNIRLNQEFFVVYDYDVEAFGMDFIEAKIQRILDAFLLDNNASYYSESTEQAYRAGTTESIRDINLELIAAAVAGALAASQPRKIDIEVFLFSANYQQGLANYIQRGASEIRTLSKRAADQVFQVISSGILANQSRKQIIEAITKRFNVAKSNAKRIVQTEINRAYNDSKIDTIKAMRGFGFDFVGQHLSALLPTTRPTHAARHNKFYTAEQQQRWWEIGANRINCYCSFTPVLRSMIKTKP